MAGTRCISCMHLTDENTGKCPYCGFDPKFYQVEYYQLPIGSTLADGRYYVGRVIGEGGFGITYIGWDEKFSSVVAIKEFYSKDIASRHNSRSLNIVPYRHSDEERYKHVLKRVQREAITINQFNNLPSIVDVKDFFEENNTVYIVMEYVEGSTLKDHMREFPQGIEPQKCLQMFRPLISSLTKIHEAKIIHRDISLDNIIYQRDGTLKLLDFGSARMTERNESESTSVTVKIGYAPIEQYINNPKLHGPWIDVYSVCVCMYNCLTGKELPDSQTRDDSDDIWANVTANVPRNIKKVLSRGLAVNHENRIKTSLELYECLYEGKNPEPAPKPSPKPTKKKDKKDNSGNNGSKRKIVIFAGVGAAALIVAAAAGVMTLKNVGTEKIAVTDISLSLESGTQQSIVSLLPVENADSGEWTVTAKTDNAAVAEVDGESIIGTNLGSAVITYVAKYRVENGKTDEYSGKIAAEVINSVIEQEQVDTQEQIPPEQAEQTEQPDVSDSSVQSGDEATEENVPAVSPSTNSGSGSKTSGSSGSSGKTSGKGTSGSSSSKPSGSGSSSSGSNRSTSGSGSGSSGSSGSSSGSGSGSSGSSGSSYGSGSSSSASSGSSSGSGSSSSGSSGSSYGSGSGSSGTTIKPPSQSGSTGGSSYGGTSSGASASSGSSGTLTGGSSGASSSGTGGSSGTSSSYGGASGSSSNSGSSSGSSGGASNWSLGSGSSGGASDWSLGSGSSGGASDWSLSE